MAYIPRYKRKKPPTRFGVVMILAVAGIFVYVHKKSTPVTVSSSTQVALADVKPATPLPTTCPELLNGQKLVAIQAGHYQTDQLPDELSNLRYDFGASSGGANEVDVTLDVAQKTVNYLMSHGVKAVVLPSTIPEGYCASAFVAVHADGNDDSSVYGYKVAPSLWDTDGKAHSLSDTIQVDFGQETSMSLNPTVTDNMTQYYAFNFQKFSHTINANTPGALIEVGFISNDIDRSMMINHSEEMATGIGKGIVDYLNGKTVTVQEPTVTP